MTLEEAIQNIEVAKAEVEWYLPMDYAASFDMAIEALKIQIQIRDNFCQRCGQKKCWSEGKE